MDRGHAAEEVEADGGLKFASSRSRKTKAAFFQWKLVQSDILGTYRCSTHYLVSISLPPSPDRRFASTNPRPMRRDTSHSTHYRTNSPYASPRGSCFSRNVLKGWLNSCHPR